MASKQCRERRYSRIGKPGAFMFTGGYARHAAANANATQ
jgi:hypothetical protein